MQIKTLGLTGAIILGLGIASAGYFIGDGWLRSKQLVRTVSVKGLAEKDVQADLAIWEIVYREVGNDLNQLNTKLQQDANIVVSFLKLQNFTDAEISRLTIRLEDRLANVYNQNNTSGNNEQRYIATAGIKLRSNNVLAVQKAVQSVDKLLEQGIPLAFDMSSLSPNPSYYYTQLDKIRPSMLAQATQSARMVAAQFANDSGSALGQIQRANQGVYQILNKDNSNSNEATAIDKTVRLVTSIDYALK